MSWSVFAIGKPAAVAAKLAGDFEKISHCPEPENTAKNKVAEAVAVILAAFPPNRVVRVEAGGSQFEPDSSKPEEKQNSLSVKLEMVPGFVE